MVLATYYSAVHEKLDRRTIRLIVLCTPAQHIGITHLLFKVPLFQGTIAYCTSGSSVVSWLAVSSWIISSQYEDKLRSPLLFLTVAKTLK